MLSITCVNCRRVAPPKGLKEDSGYAVCPWCSAVFEIPGADFDEAREDLPGLKWYGRLSIPPSFSVSALDGDPWNDRETQRREFVMTWPLGHVMPMHRSLGLFFSIFSWFTIYIMTTIPPKEEIGLRIIFFCMAAMMALPITYFTLVSFINRTHLSITNGLLRVRHGPLPWADNITLSTDDIQRLYCARETSQRGTFYELRAKLRGGDVCPVVSKLKHPTIAMLIQQRIEDALGFE